MRLRRLLSAMLTPRTGAVAALLPVAVAGLVLWGPPYLVPEWTSSARRIDWSDLIATGAQAAPTVRGLVQHGELSATEVLDTGGVVPALNGQEVTIAGSMVPLRLEADRVSQFLLVPYAGACIHVPPPPANQIILVNTSEPVEVTGLLEAVTVTGTHARGRGHREALVGVGAARRKSSRLASWLCYDITGAESEQHWGGHDAQRELDRRYRGDASSPAAPALRSAASLAPTSMVIRS
jgi:uncharacterized protein